MTAVAGPSTHAARSLDGEPVLWAAFARNVLHDVPGRYPDGRPKPNLAARIAGEVLAALPDGGPDEGRRVPDVVVFGAPDATAMRHQVAVTTALSPEESAALGPSLWALTPRCLHVGRRVDEAPPQGFLRGVFTPAERPRVAVRPVRWLHSVPRAEVAGFEVATRSGEPCLRMGFPDGSGFDFLFLAHDWPAAPTGPEQYHRLLALSTGRTDQWS